MREGASSERISTVLPEALAAESLTTPVLPRVASSLAPALTFAVALAAVALAVGLGLGGQTLTAIVSAFAAIGFFLVANALRAREVVIRRLASEHSVLHTSHQQIDAVSRAKSDFIANISHEIRTPLGGVLGTTALLAETPLSDEQ